MATPEATTPMGPGMYEAMVATLVTTLTMLLNQEPALLAVRLRSAVPAQRGGGTTRGEGQSVAVVVVGDPETGLAPVVPINRPASS